MTHNSKRMMKKRKAVIGGFLVAGSLVGAGALVATGTVGAGAPGGNVPAHSHHLVLPHGTHVQVGPDACSNGTSRAFDNFHNKVHNGAQGLDPDVGVVILSGGGCP